MTDQEFSVQTKKLREQSAFSFDDLCRVVEVLMSENGCPWDREQTHESIRKNMLEEAYEAAEAIDLKDSKLLCEELGDVMLQVVMHAYMSNTENEFDINDVCTGICSKLIVRHPHVFGDEHIENSDGVLDRWETIKQQTKGRKTVTEELSGISKALPALVRAHKIGKKAGKAGFDFVNPLDALDKAEEEINELRQAILLGDQANIEEEAGDLLLAVVNTARLAGVESEEALNKANEKFCNRFSIVEQLALKDNKDIKDLDEETLLLLWNEAKKQR